MPVRPSIAVSPNLRLDDRAAGKIVDAMLVALGCDCERSMVTLRNALQSSDDLPVGNHKARQRFFKRVSQAAGTALLASAMSRSAGRSFAMHFDLWAPSTAGFLPRDNAKYAWLVGNRLSLLATSRNAERRVDCAEMLALTRHSLIRLVQRAKCSTPEDLTKVLKGAWPLLMQAITVSDLGRLLPSNEGSGWVVPVTAPDGAYVYLVLKPGVQPGPIGMITTCLSESMIDTRHLAKLEEVLKDGSTDVAHLREAFQATVAATRRGRK